MKHTTIRDARNTLTQLVRKVEKGQPMGLTRRGKPVAVLVSDREFHRLMAVEMTPKPRFSEWYPKWLARLPPGFKGISDAEVDRWRDRSPDGGRPPLSWDR